MSQFCPLCGNNKSEKALFCPNCKNKIEKEYEVDVPEESQITKNEIDEQDLVKCELKDDNFNIEETEKDLTTKTALKKKSKRSLFSWLILLGVLLVAGFFYYNQVVRKDNLDRSKWDTAVKEKSVNGYLEYMQAFPTGKYYDLAQENLMKLKGAEAEMWKKLQNSENTAELRDFMTQYTQSPYNSLVKKRLDSLTWVAALNDNTVESYSNYMVLSQGGEFSGDYFGDAQQRYEMLFQSYPVTQTDLDSIKNTIDGFFTALSALDANKISDYLAPRVFRFFNSGGDEREKIVGELIISGARTETSTVKFLPNMNAVAYEKTLIEHYKVNVPAQKTYIESGKQKTVSGYIIHIELDSNFQIITISESKPFAEAM